MPSPVLLDLFCGASGAAVGYARAGFRVIGVDHRPQPHYPFDLVCGDALEVLAKGYWSGFDIIHASPPCQGYMTGGTHHDAPRLIEPLRPLLEATELPYVIENVPGAPLRRDYVMCGSQFGLPLRRHRIFETNMPKPKVKRLCDHRGPVVGVYGHPHGERGAWPTMLPSTLESWQHAMGINWMTAQEMTQAIPPAYTELIGAQILRSLR